MILLILPHHHIQPFLLFPTFPDIGGDHCFNNFKLVERGEEFFENLFGHVGKVAAVAVALEGAVFEGGVEVAAFFERAGEVFENLGKKLMRDCFFQ